MYYRLIPKFLVVLSILFFVTSIQSWAQVNEAIIVVSDDPSDIEVSCRISGQKVIEDFEDTLIKTGNFDGCQTPLNTDTSDECFYFGTIAPGFTYSTYHIILLEAYGVITPKVHGVTNVAIVANMAEEYSRFTFDVPTDFIQFDIADIVPLLGRVWVRAYDQQGKVMAQELVQLNAPESPVTVTIISPDTTIARVDVQDNTFYTWELFYNLRFCRY